MKSIVVVLDSLGIGGAPDAVAYGDEDANTFLHVFEKTKVALPNLEKLGLFNTIDYGNNPDAAFAIGEEHSFGKDTVVGHWELMGCVKDFRSRTFPSGFPRIVVDRLKLVFGREILGNSAASGTEIINEYGLEHTNTGYPIVYTSADSVLQIAANIEVVPLEELYRFCEYARGIMSGEYAVDRVIARPFVFDGKGYVRTADRKDYSLKPPRETILDRLLHENKEVIGIGKIGDIFPSESLTQSVHTQNNVEGILKTIETIKTDFDGMLFTNLVDFDMKYGHRNDYEGYAHALKEFDDALPDIKGAMDANDILIIAADHGCDPTVLGTDHTREHVPILLYGHSINPGSRGIVEMSSVGATVAKHQDIENWNIGTVLI